MKDFLLLLLSKFIIVNIIIIFIFIIVIIINTVTIIITIITIISIKIMIIISKYSMFFYLTSEITHPSGVDYIILPRVNNFDIK